MEQKSASLRVVDARPVLRFERRLRHSVDTVWNAITDPAEMAHWFPTAMRTTLRVGASITFDVGDGVEFLSEGEILELDPPKVYAFRWADSVLRFELIPDADGCLLVFTHTLGGRGTWGDPPSAARQAAGWDGCLELLAARLDGRQKSLDGPWWLERAEHYVEKFGLGEGEIRETENGYLVRFERDLVQPVDEVWNALVEGQTLMIGGSPPARSTNGYVPAGPVTALDAPILLEYEWSGGNAPTGRVRFELKVQIPIGCRLVVTQTIPRTLAGLRATALAAWHTHLELLFAALHGDIRCPWPAERTEKLRAMYADRLG